MSTQLELESRTTAAACGEMDDMLQRIERHCRNEQALRRKAEEDTEASVRYAAEEREARRGVEEELRARRESLHMQQDKSLRAALECVHTVPRRRREFL